MKFGVLEHGSLGGAGDHHHAVGQSFVRLFLHGGGDVLLDLELLEGLCRAINRLLQFDSVSKIKYSWIAFVEFDNPLQERFFLFSNSLGQKELRTLG